MGGYLKGLCVLTQGIMGYQNHAQTLILAQSGNQPEDLSLEFKIQVRGGLIQQYHFGLLGQRPCIRTLCFSPPDNWWIERSESSRICVTLRALWATSRSCFPSNWNRLRWGNLPMRTSSITENQKRLDKDSLYWGWSIEKNTLCVNGWGQSKVSNLDYWF